MSEISGWLELNDIKDEKVTNLSNSQKQKVVITRALINNPSIIVADQPETFILARIKKNILFV